MTATMTDTGASTGTSEPVPCHGLVKVGAGPWGPCPHPAAWDLIVRAECRETAGTFCDAHKASAEAMDGCAQHGHPITLVYASPL